MDKDNEDNINHLKKDRAFSQVDWKGMVSQIELLDYKESLKKYRSIHVANPSEEEMI